MLYLKKDIIDGGSFMKILFICTGNTCRSPMAKALLQSKVPEAEVQSAGIYAGENQHANQNTIKVLQEIDIPLNHHSQPVTNHLLNWADLILTMTTQHKQLLIMQYPNYQDKYFTLKEYVSETDKKVWDQLKKLYADYEEKRSIFIQENAHKLNNKKLDESIATRFQGDIIKIQQLESTLINYDISDPFGGELRVYEETLKEMEQYIDLLVKKTKK